MLKILSDKNINKIFHYARADLLFIKKYLKIDVENVNCTKIMSKLARSYSDKHGLKDLVKEFIGTEISKICSPQTLEEIYQKNNFNIVRKT